MYLIKKKFWLNNKKRNKRKSMQLFQFDKKILQIFIFLKFLSNFLQVKKINDHSYLILLTYVISFLTIYFKFHMINEIFVKLW